jgi:hypothetical protein
MPKSAKSPKVSISAAPHKTSTKATLTDLNKLQGDLTGLLNGLNPDLQEPLKTRFRADNKLIASSSLIRLKNTKDKNLALNDSKKSLGLAALQADTKSFFEKTLTIEKATDTDKANRKKILEKLDEIHRARQEILARAVSQDAESMANAAYKKLMDRLRMPIDKPAKGTGTHLDDDTTSEFLETLKKQNHARLQGPSNEKNEGLYIELLHGNVLSSNDPVELGLAFAAAKWKRVEISSTNPEFALIAARTALDAGVEQVVFYEHLKKNF